MAEKRAERLQIMLTLEEVKAVEEWRYKNRMPSRSAAVRALMKMGLDHASSSKFNSKSIFQGDVSSSEIGIVNNKSRVDKLFEERPGGGPQVVVLSDQSIVGVALKALAEEAGCSVIGPVQALNDLGDTLSTDSCSAAIVDFDSMGDGQTESISRLEKARVPILVCTDEDPRETFGDDFRRHRSISRSSAQDNLKSTLAAMIKEDVEGDSSS